MPRSSPPRCPTPDTPDTPDPNGPIAIEEDLRDEREAFHTLVQEGGQPSHPVGSMSSIIQENMKKLFRIGKTEQSVACSTISCSLGGNSATGSKRYAVLHTTKQICRIPAKGPRTATIERAHGGCESTSGSRSAEQAR